MTDLDRALHLLVLLRDTLAVPKPSNEYRISDSVRIYANPPSPEEVKRMAAALAAYVKKWDVCFGRK